MFRTLLRLAPAAALLWWGLPATAQDGLAATNKLTDGGFEGGAPSYWAPSGAGATWATDRARSGERALRLAGNAAATWTQAEAVRNWTNRFPGNADLTFGAFVWTDGVNTNPTGDAAKFQLVYTFRNAAGTDILGAPVVVDLPQATASTGGWVEVSTATLGALVLPEDAVSATIVVRKGPSATGSVWVDDFFVRTSTPDVWAGDIHGANVDVPGDWYLYWDGFTGGVAQAPFAVTQTTAEAHTGSRSLRIERTNPAATSEAVSISERVPVTPGRPVLVSYWVKTEGNADPSTIGTGDNNIGLTALWYSSMQSGAAGYNEIGGADIRLNGEFNPQVIPLLPRQADNGWTQYSFVLNPLAGAVGMELRLRYWHAFTGVTYWDDVFIGDVADVVTEVPNLLSDAARGFEGGAPSYWAPSGAGATWATDRARSGERALRLAGNAAATWTQAEAVRNWTNRFPGNADLTFGAFVWTDGVNTNPAGDAAKFQLVYTFRNAAGTDILGAPVVVDLPQATASTGGWVEVSTATLGALVLPEDAASATIVVRKGAQATGSVWVDDFFVRTSTPDVWAGDIHGANVDVPGDWYLYWDGFTGGVAQAPFAVTQTTAEAHTGSQSLRIERTNPAATSEAVAISPRVPAAPGEPMLLSYWVKTEGNADPSTIGTGDNNIGLTALWYSSMQSGAAGYNEIGGADIRLNGEFNPQVIPLLPRQADNGWTNYAFVLNPLPNSAGLEMRLRYWHAFTGATYWDDIAITNIAGENIFSTDGEAPAPGTPGASASRWLRANAPNPFAESTELRFTLPQAEQVTVEVYDLVGRRVALLADAVPMAAGERTLTFERASLPAGTYFVVLRTLTHTEAQQVTVVR